jgi:Cu/Ag efflux protein CusF
MAMLNIAVVVVHTLRPQSAMITASSTSTPTSTPSTGDEVRKEDQQVHK